jgi:hypothetical protein
MNVLDNIVIDTEERANELFEDFKSFGYSYISRNYICDLCGRPWMKRYPDERVCRGIDLNGVYETQNGWIIQ